MFATFSVTFYTRQYNLVKTFSITMLDESKETTTELNPCPAEPGCTLLLQTVYIQIRGLLKKPTDLALHYLPLNM